MEQQVAKPTLEPAYLKLIRADQELNRQRATNLPILNEEAQKNIVESCVYSGYFSEPITKDFIKQYILNKVEFPIPLTCLAQTVTELNGKIKALFGDAHSSNKAAIEMRQAAIRVKRAQAKIKSLQAIEEPSEETGFQIEEAQCELESAMLDVGIKSANLKEIELTAMARYKEAMEWRACAEDFMKDAGYTSLDEVPWDQIRMKGMEAKIKVWGKLAARGKFEETPTRLTALLSNTQAFDAGYNEEAQHVHQEQLAHAERQKRLANAGVSLVPAN